MLSQLPESHELDFGLISSVIYELRFKTGIKTLISIINNISQQLDSKHAPAHTTRTVPFSLTHIPIVSVC